MNPNQDSNPTLSPTPLEPNKNGHNIEQPGTVVTPNPETQNTPVMPAPQVNPESTQSTTVASNQPVTPPPSQPSTSITGYGSGHFGPNTPPSVMSSTKKPFDKKLAIILVLALVFILGGSAYAYFGYYMSPSKIWSDSLSNASSGYNRLVSYINTQSQAHYSGIKSNGNFALTSGSAHFSGSEAMQSEGATSSASVKLDLGVGNIDFEERSVPVSMSSSPDIYFQLNGVSNLSANAGAYGPLLSKINGQWIVIDHNLLDDLKSQVKSQSSGARPKLTWAMVESYLMTTESINKNYLFTSDQSTSVTRILKSYGSATVNGQKTDHYLVGFNKTNLGNYYYALCTAFSKSAVGSYLQQTSGGLYSGASSCQSAKNSASSVNSTDTFQVWDNVNTRLPYQIRVADKTNPAEIYADVGLNYTGGKSYPFYVSGQSGANTFYSITATLNTSNNSLALKVNVTDNSSSKVTFSGDFNIEPSNQSLKVTAPSGAIPLTTELNNLGISLPVFGTTNPSSNLSLPNLNQSTSDPVQQTLNQPGLAPNDDPTLNAIDPSSGLID